jgi:hypothetical protein
MGKGVDLMTSDIFSEVIQLAGVWRNGGCGIWGFAYHLFALLLLERVGLTIGRMYAG